jgi:excisionase family DNA binding protein
MPSGPRPEPTGDWLTSREAAIKLGCSVDYLRKLARQGHIGSRRLFDGWTWFSRADVEKLYQRSLRPKTQGVEP